jgi:RHS repeat-associated protein
VDANPFRYRGYYYDKETKLYYLNSRYYDPETGIFISPDNPLNLFITAAFPFGANLYAYCLNNPVMYTDSTGMSIFSDIGNWFKGAAKTVWSGVTAVGNWIDDHAVEIAIGTAFIIGGALVTALTAGVGTGFWVAFGGALLSSSIQVGASMAVSAAIGGIMSVANGGGFFDNIGNSLASGFMWGGIFAGTAQMLSGAMSITRSLASNFNGKMLGNVKLWSPNSATNLNIGGTLIKFGKYNRFDVEVGRGLHMAWKIFGNKVNHIPLGILLSGGIGGLF